LVELLLVLAFYAVIEDGLALVGVLFNRFVDRGSAVVERVIGFALLGCSALLPLGVDTGNKRQRDIGTPILLIPSIHFVSGFLF
jgi:hypothetical protein